jgi:hypothetical protein
MRRGGRKDGNHHQMVEVMLKCGFGLIDLSELGRGVPDFLVSVPPHSKNLLLLADIKNPSTAYGRKGLNKRQIEFAESWCGSPVYVLRTHDDVLAMAAGEFQKLESYGGNAPGVNEPIEEIQR